MKPMLAATVEAIEALEGRYPLLASPKLDGVRALVYNCQLVSRNLKPIPNAFVHKALPLPRIDGLDGELVVGKATSPTCFRATTSGVMSRDGEPDFTFWVFDRCDEVTRNACGEFRERLAIAKNLVKHAVNYMDHRHRNRIQVVPQALVHSAGELYNYEQKMLDKGFEGVMLRTPNAPYKEGRSTFKEGYLMKLKRFADSEAVILDAVELQHNNNEATKDALGRTKRTTHKAGKTAGGALGALRVRDLKSGVEFDLGGGFTELDRTTIWASYHCGGVVGEVVKYKYFPTGSKDKPRFPTFLGFRAKGDL